MKSNFPLKLFTSALILFFISILSVFGQSSQIRENAPRVFIDCEDCDMEHIRTEINFINFVTETREADIHIIVITQTTGSRGQFYTLQFIGQREFSGKRDTLNFNSSPDDTYSIRRQKLVNYIKLGLIEYVKTGPLAEHITVSFSPPAGETLSIVDNWRNWVFTERITGQASDDDNYRQIYLINNLRAQKITKDFKTVFYWETGYSGILYKAQNTEVINTYFDFDNLTAFSLNDHWSYGFRVKALRSTFTYTDFMTGIGPAIEYNFLPYSKATTKQFTINYSIGPQYWNYADTTRLYEVLEDYLWQQRIEVATEFVEKWGRIRFSSRYTNYLHDFSLNNISLITSVGLRIVKGLEFNVGGYYMFINDQHFLPKVDPTDLDVYTRRRQLPTKFRSGANISISYTFGSIYSNVVNPRFGY